MDRSVSHELTEFEHIEQTAKRTKAMHQYLHANASVLVTYQSLVKLPTALEEYLNSISQSILETVDGSYSIDDTTMQLTSILKAQTEANYGHP